MDAPAKSTAAAMLERTIFDVMSGTNKEATDAPNQQNRQRYAKFPLTDVEKHLRNKEHLTPSHVKNAPSPSSEVSHPSPAQSFGILQT